REQVELALQDVEDLLGRGVPVRPDVEARPHLGLEGRPLHRLLRAHLERHAGAPDPVPGPGRQYKSVRHDPPSRPVPSRLALRGAEHRHLRELAGLAATPPVSDDDPQSRLQRLVDAVTPNAASVYDVHFDYLAWNEPYRRIRHDPAGLPAGRRNLLWMMFTDAEHRTRMPTWDRAARALRKHFR